jgi:beta-glucosidase
MSTPLNQAEIERKVESLVARMSLDQKIGQMTQGERLFVRPEDVRDYHLGSVLSGGGSVPGDNLPTDWVAMNDAYWAASMEEDDDHLPIPLLYGVDAIHGNANVRGATVLPHNIGLGAAGDPDLLERIARVTRREVLATGVDWTFAPTLAVVRDDRWGRTYESYSEDPEIVSEYAGRFVTGLQDDLGADSLVACAKHWVGDGGTTRGIDQGDTEAPRSEFYRLHIAPYLSALEAGVLTVMVSLSSWNGEKCHGSRLLITDILKGELGFRGFVVSDWDGTDQLDDDYERAVALAVNAGIDMFMVPEKWKAFIGHLRDLVWRGAVPMERIDDAVRRVLRVKFAYGLFDRPRPAERPWSNHPGFGSAEHRDVAREAVRKSLVLLKNENGTLPLDRNARILVAGKNADDRGHQCGGFTVEWQGVSGNSRIEGGTSIWEGIKELAPDAALSFDGSQARDGDFDVGVVVIGETPYAEGMGDLRTEAAAARGSHPELKTANMEPYGDSLELAELHPEDLETIRTIAAEGIPVVAVLISGRPLLVNPELEAASAFVAAWLPGSEGGGVAEVLFGDCDFQGKLSFSWPGSLSDHYNRGDEPYDPLFPYGFGLRMSD